MHNYTAHVLVFISSMHSDEKQCVHMRELHIIMILNTHSCYIDTFVMTHCKLNDCFRTNARKQIK